MLQSTKPVILAGLLAAAGLPGHAARGEGALAKSCLSSPRAWFPDRPGMANRRFCGTGGGHFRDFPFDARCDSLTI